MENQEKLNWIVEYIFKDLSLSEIEILNRYSKRDLPEGTRVTRFAPSPTGFIHIGGIYSALIDERLAHQSNGIFYLRIEDTDKKREIEGTVDLIVKALNRFGLKIDEGFVSETEQIGNYGPYIQSQREDIYKVFIKKLILENKAYVCFATSEELAEITNIQTQRKELIGYRKEWAIWRNKSLDETIENLKQNKPFVIRFRSEGDFNTKIKFEDQIKGMVELPENELDTVIMKGDGLPTYHFAHVIDDHLMGTTDVIRGDEWLPSVPIHIQMFKALGFEIPRYFHMAPIEKMEEGSRRKLSKRKDPEANVEYYYEQGYPTKVIIEYLLNLANSSFEDWRNQNPESDINDFKIEINKLKVSGALFDYAKLDFLSKEFISKLTADGVYNYALGWSKTYDSKLFDLLFKNKEYSERIFNIEREDSIKKRKDISKWSDVFKEINYFFDEIFETTPISKDLILPVSFEDAKNIITEFMKTFDMLDPLDVWFNKIKEVGKLYGYADTLKTFKEAEIGQYKGHIVDVARIFRVALTGTIQTPDLYQIMQVMGKDRVVSRLNKFIS